MSDAVTRLNAALEGRYAIERELGQGGMATVYLAKDLKHNRSVALKVLKPELAAVVGAERFLAEIEVTANLQHPHILPLHDSGEADSFLYYVMPFIEGETLRDRIDREKQLPVDDALGIATAVANALQTAHDQGVVHRDIKPANILLWGWVSSKTPPLRRPPIVLQPASALVVVPISWRCRVLAAGSRSQSGRRLQPSRSPLECGNLPSIRDSVAHRFVRLSRGA